MITRFTEFLNENIILEKSNLSALGVPREVMQPIQKDFALPSDTKWDKVKYKKDITNMLKNGDKNLFLQISINSIKVFVSYSTPKGIMYFVDKYIYDDDDWGGGYDKRDREYKTLTQLSYEIDMDSIIYKLDGDFSIDSPAKRKMNKKEISFSNFTEQFKTDFIKKFDIILKKISGSNYKKAKDKVSKKAKEIEIKNRYLISSLDNPLNGPNGLSILDEFIIQFEDEYTEYFTERLDIQELSEYFGRDRVLRMFMYYIYTGRKMV